MGVARLWARLRGERCLVTTMDASLYKRGQVLVVGNRAYVITRVLRNRAQAGGWEIWSRRQVNKARRSAR